jgi:hypothetical protein
MFSSVYIFVLVIRDQAAVHILLLKYRRTKESFRLGWLISNLSSSRVHKLIHVMENLYCDRVLINLKIDTSFDMKFEADII